MKKLNQISWVAKSAVLACSVSTHRGGGECDSCGDNGGGCDDCGGPSDGK